MDEKALFMQFWDKEAAATRKVLSRIPEKSNYRPDPKSRTRTRDRVADRARGSGPRGGAAERRARVGGGARARDRRRRCSLLTISIMLRPPRR